jgi:chemotaxis-related protein WspD
MRVELPSRELESKSSTKLNDCWNKLGVWGNRKCGELPKVIHCRDCVVYSSAAAQLLGGELPTGYLEGWTRQFAIEQRVENRQRQAALIFRIGAEWLALSPTNLQEIAEGRPIHSLPRGQSNSLLGLANIRGELLVCVALDRVLGLEKRGPEKSSSQRALNRRMVVAGREGARFVFPVEEVDGIHWFNPNDLQAMPSTVAKAQATYIKGIILWGDKSVGCLDDQLLFDMLDGNLT